MKQGKLALIISITWILLSITAPQANAKTYQSREQEFNFRDFVTEKFGNANKYTLELVVGIFIITYTINYWLGRRANQKHAQLWIQENHEVFKKEFSEVGAAGASEGEILEAESANYFKFYASGRRNCPYARVIIELKNRQNILSMTLFNIIWTEKDRVRVEIPITVATTLPFIFAVVRRKEAKYVQKHYTDINTFCQTMTFHDIAHRYIVMGEHQETAEYILTDRFVATLKKYHLIIEMISFSDMNAPHKQLLRADMMMPHSTLKNPKDFNEILETLFYLVDHVAHYKMSPTCRKRAEKERELYERNKEKTQNKAQQQKRESEPKSKAEKKNEKNDDNRRKLQKKAVKLG